jgi:hypothetical protein
VSHRIPCERFPGQPVELRYRRGGVVYKHKLGPGVQMLRVKGASAIVLKGVRVNPYLEG